jgi:hypothetical protein
MSTIDPLLTIEDYRRTLDVTLNMLEAVVNSNPNTPGYLQLLADADEWSYACRYALEEAKRRSP